MRQSHHQRLARGVLEQGRRNYMHCSCTSHTFCGLSWGKKSICLRKRRDRTTTCPGKKREKRNKRKRERQKWRKTKRQNERGQKERKGERPCSTNTFALHSVLFFCYSPRHLAHAPSLLSALSPVFKLAGCSESGPVLC